MPRCWPPPPWRTTTRDWPSGWMPGASARRRRCSTSPSRARPEPVGGVQNQCEVPRVEGRTGEPAGLHIGVIGGGQLGQMLGLAGVAMGHRFTFLDPAMEPPAASVGRHLRAEFDDAEALERLAVECDLVTLEFE